MPFLVDYLDLPEDEQSYSEWLRRVASYREYLESIRDSLPAEAYAFANLQWSSDFNEHGHPHDTVVQDFELRTVYSGARYATTKSELPYRLSRTRFLKRRWQRGYLGKRYLGRDLDIFVRLFGAWYDGHIELTYKRVHAFSVSALDFVEVGYTSPVTPASGWLTHEISLSERGYVVNQVRFDCGVFWRIECEDIIYRWVPLEEKAEGE